MQKRFKTHLVAGALAVAGLQSLGCGNVDMPAAPAVEAGQVQQANTVPTGVTAATNDTFTQQLRDDIAAALVERRSVPVNRPELLPPNLVPDLFVAEDRCQVWVSFYSEGAGQLNSLGYFVYPNGQPPSSVPLATRQSNIIFSNASASGSGGTLVQGNRFQLGRNTDPNTDNDTTFRAGSRIGFYLIANGWTGSAVDFNRTTYYTVDALNPESDPTKKRHALIVRHADAQRLVMGFEDLNRMSGSDDDFNDVVFTVNWSPATCLNIVNPDIDPDASCQAVKTRNPASPSGWYRLDPCGTRGVQTDIYYCDMTSPGSNGIVGGWTVGGWQEASARTTLGLERRGTTVDTSTNWSRPLSCLPFNEAMVFNRTFNERFTETLRGAQFRVNAIPFALGEPGRSFNQGNFGPTSTTYTPITQGCVSYNFDGTIFADWACVTDPAFGGTAKGHIADYAMDYNCSPAPAYNPARAWAWANNTNCSRVGQDYIWGIAIR